jgi:hypothetical protein
MNSVRRTPSPIFVALVLAGLALAPWAAAAQRAGNPGLLRLIPKVEGWAETEAPRSYFPDTLYEYIDGAAESYIGYDFRALAVAEFARRGGQASLTVEIYDMGDGLDAFGIYSAERYPDNKTMDVGTHGYIEGEALNFVAGTYYVKLLGFNAGEDTASILEAFARAIASGVGTPGAIPALFAVFPGDGRVPNSEKYIRRNVFGFDFLGNGYLVSYTDGGSESEAFVIEPGADGDPAGLMKRVLDFFAGEGQAVEPAGPGFHVRNKYGQNMYIAVSGKRLCGMNRVPDASVKAAAARFAKLAEAVGKAA